MHKLIDRTNFYRLIQLSVVLVFLGRAYQFYFFGAPFRAILWDESLLTPIVEGLFNVSWNEYATSRKVNAWIEAITKFCASILILAAILTSLWDKISFDSFKKIIIRMAVGILIVIAVCIVKDKNYDLLQFFELSIQIAVPVIFLMINNASSWNKNRIYKYLNLAIALTFIPHGLFAMGIIYVPGHFIDMTIMILGVSETTARQLLWVVGLLDILASIVLFIPRFSRYALYYMIVWGLMTACARVVAGFDIHFLLNSLHNHLYLTIYRLPHGLLPLGSLLLWYMIYGNSKSIKA